MGIRKYQEVVGYWVYSIQVPSINKHYIGVSKQQCYKRWCKSYYKDTVLEPYLEEFDSMIKTVLVDNLTKEEALKYEDNIIRALQMNNLCINERRSGLIEVSDVNTYMRKYRKDNPEYRERQKQCNKQYYENNKEKYQEYKKQWDKDNPEYMKQYYEKNKEKIREQQRQYRLKKKLEKQQQPSLL